MADFERAWQALLCQQNTLPPTDGVRDSWRRGRERYAAWMIRVQEPTIAERVGQIAEQFEDCASPVPLSQLHVTTFVVGFPVTCVQHDDDVEQRVLREQAARLSEARLGAFRLSVGGAGAFTTAPFLEVHDRDGGLARIRGALGAVFERSGRRELRFADFLPHVTIAHFTHAVPVSRVVGTLSAWRHLPSIEWTVTAIELVDFDARIAHAAFRTLELVHL